MKYYNFLEIGTCFVDTLLERATNDEVGLSVEPLKEYLDRLPNKPQVTKIHAAIVTPEDFKKTPEWELYYIDEPTVFANKLNHFLVGCNSLGKPHDFHTHYYEDLITWNSTPNPKQNLPTTNLLEKGLVKKIIVPCLTYKHLVERYNIGFIEHLKIDTEGYDCKILNSIIDFHKNKVAELPNSLVFESNTHTDKNEVNEMKNRLQSLGYQIVYSHHDTLAKKISPTYYPKKIEIKML
jgi:hypothetical protein